MPKKQNSKEKILTIRVSQEQYKKIQDLAYIRSMNVTEYIRQTAVGNRIKPTVIEYPKEQTTIDDYNSNNDTNNLYEVIEQLEEDNEALKSDRNALRQRHDQLENDIEQYKRENEIFHHLLQHFDSTAFMNFNTYRDDRQLKNAIKRLKEQ
ncbi:plasmid mobilization protein [Acinetobacter baumannii]|uniref:plasmid mobilization protein n=1 Tax=Acinetobacter baumannii TaxID=470 RepID=UPI00387B25BE